MHVFKHTRKTSDFRCCGFGGFLLVEALPQALANVIVLERRVAPAAMRLLRKLEGNLRFLMHKLC